MRNIFKKTNKGFNRRFTTKGYTILEMMISISIFSLIAVFGIGTLLNANIVHNKSADMRDILDNLSFIMEDMSRNLRTGFNYHCYEGSEWPSGNISSPPGSVDSPESCNSGNTIAFEEAHSSTADDSDQWVYRIHPIGGGNFNILKSVNGGVSFVQMNVSDVKIKGGSHFSVFGAEAPSTPVSSGDVQQPVVTINLVGEINYKNTVTPFSLQSSVSQRLIDARSETP